MLLSDEGAEKMRKIVL